MLERITTLLSLFLKKLYSPSLSKKKVLNYYNFWKLFLTLYNKKTKHLIDSKPTIQLLVYSALLPSQLIQSSSCSRSAHSKQGTYTENSQQVIYWNHFTFSLLSFFNKKRKTSYLFSKKLNKTLSWNQKITPWEAQLFTFFLPPSINTKTSESGEISEAPRLSVQKHSRHSSKRLIESWLNIKPVAGFLNNKYRT